MNENNNINFNLLPAVVRDEVVETIVKYSNGDKEFAVRVAKGGMTPGEFKKFLSFVERKFGKAARLKVIKTLQQCFADGKAYGFSVRRKTEAELEKEKEVKKEKEKKEREALASELQAQRIRALEAQEARERRELAHLSPQERRNITAKYGSYKMGEIEFSRFAQKQNDRRFNFKY